MSKKKINKFYGRALIVPETLNAENREVEVVFATETPVFRGGWDEDYNEVLCCDESSVRMDRANKGLPVIDSHNNYSLANQIGRTTEISFRKKDKDKECRAKILLSGRKEVEGIIQDIKDGIIKDISVGYRVYKFDREPIPEGERYPIYRAVDWEPHEISFVSVPADPNCGVRSDEDKNEVEVIHSNNKIINQNLRQMITIQCPTCGHEWEGNSADSYTCPECSAEFQAMSGGDEAAEAALDEAEAPAEGAVGETAIEEAGRSSEKSVQSIRAEASLSERQRLNSILLSTRAAKLPDSYGISLFNSKKSLAACRQDIIAKAFEGGKKQISASHTANLGVEAAEKKRTAAQNAILHRALPKQFKLEEGNYFRGMTLVEIAKELLIERGISTKGKTKSEIADLVFAKRAHSTSDFPILFEEALNKSLRADYTFEPEQWDKIARMTTVSDYRAKNFYQIETKNGMHKTPEGGEIKYTTIMQAKQSIFIEKYAEGIRFTREAFINDDLDALSVIPGRFVRDWDELRGNLVWGMLINNQMMSDGQPLFHASHQNLITGATSALTEAGLEAALLNFSKQVALGGERKIRVNPRIIIVPPQLYVKAAKLLTAVTASNTQDVNVFSSLGLQIIVEPRLLDNANAWYMMADPNAIEGLYYAYLDGNDGLRVNSEDDFNTDTMKYAVRGDFGYAAIDHRGILKMAGV